MRILFIISGFILLGNISTYAWWDEGHMAIAKIAYDRLRPEIREEADRLIMGLSAAFPDSSTFVTAACWPDDIGLQGLTALASWHHSSLPYDPYCCIDLDEKKWLTAALEGKDVVFAIQQSIKTLTDPCASDWAKAIMLRFLIHFVGDVHQPLHCTNYYCPEFPEGDWGGNRYFIQWDGYEKQNLHAFWDSICGLGVTKWARPLSPEGEKEIGQLAKHISDRFPESHFDQKALQDMNVYHWRDESFELGKTFAYEGIFPGEIPSNTYCEQGQKIASSQIALAGYRLSRLLNKILNVSCSLSRP